jgi:broad specificity phosphatase PhoE
VVLTSPYLRAQRTARLVQDCGGVSKAAPEFVVDERLRERDQGILDRLTAAGVAAAHPDQAEFRRLLGKFYHRPPGGESWCDVILRLRSAMDTVALHYGGRRVLIVGHEVVVMCLRYLIENLSETELMAIDRHGDVANCGVTAYRFDPAQGKDGKLVLQTYNFVAPLEQGGAPVTRKPDAIVAAR